MTTTPSNLLWLNDILWPGGETAFRVVGEAAGPTDRAIRLTWWANPTVTTPTLLVPTGPAVVARRAGRRYHDGHGWRERVRRSAGELLLASGPLGRRLPLGGRVEMHGSLDAGVTGALRVALDEPELTVAVSLARPKSNRKPILQLLRPDGTCVGYAKVAADDRTARLVANEARWLRRRPELPLASPTLLWEGDAAGRLTAVASAVAAPRWLRRSPHEPPPPAIFRRVASLGRLGRATLSTGCWWAQVEAVLPHATAEERTLILAVADQAEANGDLELGAWHGDLTPWNLFTGRRRVHLIDWEFATDGVPVGFDLCHFHMQVGNEQLGLDAPTALTRAEALALPGLSLLGVTGREATLVWRLYLVELIRRLIDLRRSGYPVDSVQHGPAALAELSGRVDLPVAARRR